MHRLATCLLPALALAATAAAQSGAPASAPAQPASASPPAETGAGSGLRITITPRAEHTFEADLDDADGTAAVTRAGADFLFLYPVNQRLALTLGVDGDYSWYSFEGSDPAVFAGGDLGDLLDEAYKVDLLPGFRYGLDEKWTLIAGGIFEFAGEPDADIGDSATAGAFGGARYAFTDTFALTLGAAVKTRLEDNLQVLPFIGLEWKINEQFRLASRGPGLNLAVAVSDTVAVTAGVAYESRDYRLADDHDFLPEGVARDTRVPVRVGVEWAPSKTISLEGYTGVVVWQEYEFLDSGGQKRFEDNTDITPFIGVSCSFKF